MKGKRERLAESETNPFIDREGYLRYIERARERFEKAVAEERAADSDSISETSDARSSSFSR